MFGIGRPSAVDFEEHEYATKVVPEKYAKLSPDEMNQKANAKAKSAVELTRAK